MDSEKLLLIPTITTLYNRQNFILSPVQNPYNSYLTKKYKRRE
jgi:hypothetical protein